MFNRGDIVELLIGDDSVGPGLGAIGEVLRDADLGDMVPVSFHINEPPFTGGHNCDGLLGMATTGWYCEAFQLRRKEDGCDSSEQSDGEQCVKNSQALDVSSAQVKRSSKHKTC